MPEWTREVARVRAPDDPVEQEAYMMELCPDGNYDEYTAFLEHDGNVYFLVEPGLYVKMRIPPS